MRFVCYSDTHTLNNTAWENLYKIEADVLLFAGDFCGIGLTQECKSFEQMLMHLDFPYKVIIAGNHDIAVEQNKFTFNDQIIYLQDNEVVIEGIKIYGSPWSPIFFNWAFMEPYDDLRKRWAKIPDDVDILLTHTPAFGTLDYVDGFREGDEELALRLEQIKPKFHVFGHIHESYGMVEKNGIVSINCSMLNTKINKPIVFDYN